jgi:hypothetical protein
MKSLEEAPNRKSPIYGFYFPQKYIVYRNEQE